jgi:translocon-associated protein subunit alpha
MRIRVFSAIIALLLLASSIFQVGRCESAEDAAAAEVVEGGDLGIVGDETQVSGDSTYGPAPNVNTICIFPKNPGKVVPTGEVTELLVGVHNEGESAMLVHAVYATLHLPFDHRMSIQNLTVQEVVNASVPSSAQASFDYKFSVSKFLQPGSFDLVGYMLYEIDQHPYLSVFYNGSVEVVELGGFLSGESVFLLTLGIGLLALLGFWVNGQIHHFSKKTKKASKVEVGTGTADANVDEWLEGTAYARSLSTSKKEQKKKK